MDTLTFEVRCGPKQSSLVTILLTLVLLNCEVALNQNRLRNAWFLAKICFHNNQYVPFILFWFFTIHFFFRRFKLFTFLSHLLVLLFRQTVPRSINESRNVQQLVSAILKYVNSLILLYVNLHETSLVPSTSNINNIDSILIHVCLVHKTYPIQTNSVHFYQPNT